MPEKTMSTLEDIYDAWRAQDLDWLASYLPDDFCHVVHLPQTVYREAGPLRGKKRVMERWYRYVPHCEVLRYELSTFLVTRDSAAAEIDFSYRHRESGHTLETTKANFWKFESGWPVRLTEYYVLDGIEGLAQRLGLSGTSP